MSVYKTQPTVAKSGTIIGKKLIYIALIYIACHFFGFRILKLDIFLDFHWQVKFIYKNI